jgi:hypothetical protein
MGFIAWAIVRYLPAGLRFSTVRIEIDQLIVWGVNLSIIALALAAWYVARYVIGSALAIWYPSWRLVGRKGSTGNLVEISKFLSDSDLVLVMTEPINRYLNEHIRVADRWLIASSLLLDQLGVLVLLCGIVVSSLRTCLGVGIVIVVHQICRALIVLPPPVGSIRRDPGFPSIFVNYEASNNMFLSRRTALALYGALALAGLAATWLTAIAVVVVLVQVVSVVVLRTHYTMDVLAGAFAALFASSLATILMPVLF